MKFSDLKIDPRVLKALEEMKFSDMTAIQEKTIPAGLNGKDVIGEAMTGSGKTAAFGVPLIQKMEKQRGVQALVVTPTRELAVQVGNELRKFSKYVGLSVALVYGGVGYEPQIMQVRQSEIVVGTPGRIIDLMQQGLLSLGKVKVLVLDEADRMLDMGFIDDVKQIISQTPAGRQTLLFSATMPDEIVYIARRYMKDPARVTTERHIAKHLLKHIYYDVKRDEKLSLLAHLIDKEKPFLAIVFTATRDAADFVDHFLQNEGVESRAIHGGHSQHAREKVLEGFHRGRPHILIATDVAARGLDIKNVSHIFNFDIPKSALDYTHRIGRTARFGKSGKAISLLCSEDHSLFRNIVKHFSIEKGSPEEFKPRPVRFERPRRHRPQMRRGWHR